MSKKRKFRQQSRKQERTESGLPLSVIIPELKDLQKLELFFESLRKIRRPFEKDYEVLFTGGDTGEQRKRISAMEGGEDLIRKGIIKFIEDGTAEDAGTDSVNASGTDAGTGSGPDSVTPSGTDSGSGTEIISAVRRAMAGSSRENLMIFDLNLLERSFNFDEFFHIPEEEVVKHQILVPEFREQELRMGRDYTPLILFRRSYADYVLNLNTSVNYQSAIFYFTKELGLEPGLHAISQVNPFGPGEKLRGKLPARVAENLTCFFDWFIRIPLREIKTSPHKTHALLDIPTYYRTLFVVSALLIAILLPIMSLDAGQSGDDEKHYMQAEKVYNYFASHGEDKSALQDERLKLNYYGQSLDLLTYLVNRTFRIDNEYEARHFIIALTGVLTILFSGLLALRLAGYRAGFITMLMMFLAPRFLGHAMNNPMDVPFALGYIFTIYHTFSFLKKLPDFSKRHAFWIMLGIAFTISIRIGGLLLVPYVFMFAGLYVLVNKFEFGRFKPGWWRMVGTGLVYLGIIAVGGYFISLIPWPYGFQKPLKNPFEALRMMENISVAIKVLFDGAIIWSNKLPWYYISMNILYTVPVVILAGFVITPLLYPFYRKKLKPSFIFFLYFVVVFPLAYVVYKESNVYGGWRHLLFVFPSIAILSAFAWDRLVRILKPRAARLAVGVVLLAGIIHPLVHILKNHPLEYIYYNELLSAQKAYGRFENDYYMNSLKPGAEWLIGNELKDKQNHRDPKIIVSTNGSVTYYLRKESDYATPLYVRYYDRGEKNWDYGVYFCNYIHPYQLKNGLWPPAGTIKTIDVNGIPVCAIVKRETKDDYYAIQKILQRNFTEGIPELEEVNRKYPNNEIVKLRLGEVYLQTRQFSKVHGVVDECLKIYPEYDKALNLKGIAYMESGDFNNARTTFLQIIRINYRFASAYHNLGLLYARQQPPDIGTAITYFQQAIKVNGRYKPSYQALAAIYRQQGRTAEARRMENIASQL